MGNPIGHSLSPEIHTAFARETDQPIRYTAELVPLEGLTAAVTAFFGAGWKGPQCHAAFQTGGLSALPPA